MSIAFWMVEERASRVVWRRTVVGIIPIGPHIMGSAAAVSFSRRPMAPLRETHLSRARRDNDLASRQVEPSSDTLK